MGFGSKPKGESEIGKSKNSGSGLTGDAKKNKVVAAVPAQKIVDSKTDKTQLLTTLGGDVTKNKIVAEVKGVSKEERRKKVAKARKALEAEQQRAVTLRAQAATAKEKAKSSAAKRQRDLGTSKVNSLKAGADYWSGAQAQIFFGDIFVDEVFAFQFDVVTNRSPVYGYASKEFDAIAEGNRLVTGSFAINFIHQSYLTLTLAELDKDKRKIAGGDTAVTDRGFAAYQTLFKKLNTFKKKQAANQLKNLGNTEFRTLMNNSIKEKVHDSALSDRFYEGRGISALYSGMNLDEYIEPFYDTGFFDIYLTFKDPATSISGIPTLKKISKATIISSGMVVNSSGDPILETYRFLARSID